MRISDWSSDVCSSDFWVAPSYLTVAAPGLARPDGLAALAQEIARRGLAFPLVVKPDIGSQGYGVRLVRGPAELGAYLEGFPAGEAFILQDYVDWQGEAGVRHVRPPGEPERTGGVEGKRGGVRVELGGRRNIRKKKKNRN